MASPINKRPITVKTRLNILASFLFVCSLFIFCTSSGQEAHHTIHLKNGNITPVANAAHWLDSVAAAHFNQPVSVLLHFDVLPDAEQKATLQQHGIALVEYIPDNTFTAIISHPVSSAELATIPLHSIIPLRPELKASDVVWQQVNAQKGDVEVLVSFFRNIGDKAVREYVTSISGRINPSPKELYGEYKVIITANKVRTLASWYGVRCISPVTDMNNLDLQCRATQKGNIAVLPRIYGGYGLLGDSVTVGIGDECAGIYHTDIKDRIIANFNPAPIAHHGIFVTSIVGGAANVDPLAEGMAPHCNLINHLYDLILPATGSLLHDYNMTITNNSYAVILGNCSYAGTYDGYAQLLDTISLQYPDVLHVFASGNDGQNNCSPYLTGFATVAGGYQPAKNNIVVGSMTDLLDQANDESRGPVKDGRLKPEMVAVGLAAYSTILYDSYGWGAGTSMASPQVAGALAELTERYKQLNTGAQPRADILKSIILNGAADLGNPGPDFSYGFGGLDVFRSLKIMDSGHYYTGSVNSGDSQTITINIPPNTAIAKVMLCWIDPPGSAYAAKELVNDLDISVIDPLGNIHLPLVLDPAPANVNNNATEQPDHLNNVEQVTINTPSSGSYSIKVKGYSVPYPAQSFAVAYDYIPTGIYLTYPLGGEQYNNTDTLRTFWEGVTDGNTFTVEFSSDGGTTWTTESNNVPPTVRHYDWIIAGINSPKCMIRVTRNTTTQVVTSGTFVLNTKPLVQLDSVQCPGYINIHWSPIPNATSYLMYSKVVPYMQVVDAITDTMYSFRNMPLNTNSYVAVCPVFNGVMGYRSVAAIIMANTGNCTNPVSIGDLMIQQAISPKSGRMYTSTQLSTDDTLSLLLRNLYNAPCDSYSVSYSINSGTWQTLTFITPISPNGTQNVSIPGLNLSGTGAYTITAVVNNLRTIDPVLANDSIVFTVLNLPNDTLNLNTPFFDGFEDMGIETVSSDSIGISPSHRWDFITADSFGRLRSFVLDGIAITGNRSASLDNSRVVPPGTNNQLIGTFNLANDDTAHSEIRLDFDYIIYGMPKTIAGNLVNIRPNDIAPWASFFTYNVNAYPGSINHVRSLSLTDAMRAAQHNFSSSTQLSFGQNDTSLICAGNYGNGISLDNISIYTVANDVSLAGIVTPLPSNCGLVSPTPLTVQVHNGVNYSLYNINMYYSLDGGTVYTGIIDSITAKNTINYTFPQEMALSSVLTHTLSVWLNEAGDTYHFNDSILNDVFRNSPIITSYPYLENFESGNGNYYSAGINDCWQYGTPASSLINKAASGTHAWKTNLTGNYNSLEQSYLYSPCFDISSMSNPMLSFSAALDIENCGGTLCDQAYLEYSFDNINWTKLGAAGEGTNWYDSTFNIWNREGFTRWHVASILLPKPPLGQLIHLRFAMVSDPGGTYNGFAVDDVHIYDFLHPIANPDNTVSIIANVSGSSFIDNCYDDSILTSIQPNGLNLANVGITLYKHDTLYNPGATQYTFPRSYTIKSPTSYTDSVAIRFFLTDSEVVQVINDTTCPSCSRFPDAYSLGITQYANSNTNTENGTLADDTGGVFTYFHQFPIVQWVPYNTGYYAEIKTSPSAEFWFNDGGPTGNVPAGLSYLTFNAYRSGNKVKLNWYSLIDTAVKDYTILKSTDSVNFTSILDTNAIHISPTNYVKNDPATFYDTTVFYYKLRYKMTLTDSVLYSPVRRVDATDSASQLIDFTAQMISSQDVQLNWTSYLDGITDHYIVMRAIDNNNSKTVISQFYQLLSVPALRNYGQQYGEIDVPATNNIPEGRHVYYKLIPVLDDGTQITVPIQTIEWEGNNTIESIYPNPNKEGVVTINWNANTGTEMQLKITDAIGKKMYEGIATATQWYNTTTFNTFHHTKGIFIAQIIIGGNRYISKLVYE